MRRLTFIVGFVLALIGAFIAAPRAQFTLLGAGSAGGWAGPTANLTHRWPMDDANVSGTTIVDVVGALNGTAAGGVTSAAAPSGAFSSTARAFSGTGYFTVASNPLPDFTSAHSVFFWAFVTTVTNAQSFVTWGTGANDGIRLMNTNGVSGSAGGTFGLVLKQSGTDKGKFVTTQSIVNSTWIHLGYTWDGTSTLIPYANASALTLSGTSVGVSVLANFVMGARDTTPTSALTGRLYQLVSYTKVLSSTEITQLFNAK